MRHANTKAYGSGISVRAVRIANFRSLKSVEITLDSITVLIGGNNSGKTSFLEALFAAMGAGRRIITEDDVYLAPGETKAPRERSIIIDVLVRPVDTAGVVLDAFPSGSYWTALWGSGISQDENGNDFMSFRTTLKWNGVQADYVLERRFLSEWLADFGHWQRAKTKERAGAITTMHIEPIALSFMDAKRDIEDDFRRQGSFWRRLIADLGLSDGDIKTFENSLTDLNQQIVEKSNVLKHLRSNLAELYKMVSSEEAGIDIAPVARHFRDLAKGVDINFSTKGSQSFPLVRHGMGTRSLASLLVFRAYMTWRTEQAKDAVHPMLALEEPEAHLHPQAQRAVFGRIKEVPGQLIVSTHSPYIAGQAEISSLRHFRKAASETVITKVDTTGLDGEDLRKVERMVMNTRGDMLYASALVFFEGETEEQALPVFAEAYWEESLHALGITFMGVGGSGNYLPFLRLASSLGIKWYIFSDAEPKPVTDLTAALAQIGVSDPHNDSRIIILPTSENIEANLVNEGYEAEITSMLGKVEGSPTFVEEYIKQMHGKPKSNTVTRNYLSAGGRQRALIDILSRRKTRYGKPLAGEIAGCSDEKRRFPTQVRRLLEAISRDTGLHVRKI